MAVKTSKKKRGEGTIIESRAQRLRAIDLLRALAVVLMVEQHLGVWLLDPSEATGNLGRALMGVNLLGGAAAPLFVFLSGVSVALGAHGAGTLRLRGVGLLLLGLLLNLAVPAWFTPASWYVLHLLGAWLVMAPSVRKLSDEALLLLLFLVFAITVGGQTWLETPRYLHNGRMSSGSLPGGVLRLALLEGHFPLFPWLFFALLGLWAGRRHRAQKLAPQLKMCVYLGLGALALQAPSYLLDRPSTHRLPWRAFGEFSFYPATLLFCCVLGGVCLLLLAAFGYGERQGWLRRFHLFLPLGRTSLTLLFVHVLVFRQGIEALEMKNEFELLPTLSAIAFTLFAWVWLAELWAKSDFRYSLEWWLRRAPSFALGRFQDLPR